MQKALKLLAKTRLHRRSVYLRKKQEAKAAARAAMQKDVNKQAAKQAVEKKPDKAWSAELSSSPE